MEADLSYVHVPCFLQVGPRCVNHVDVVHLTAWQHTAKCSLRYTEHKALLACVTHTITAEGGFERMTQKRRQHADLMSLLFKQQLPCTLISCENQGLNPFTLQNDTLGQQIFTLDAVVFHQLCTVYQHLRGDIIYSLTLEKTCTVRSAELFVLQAFKSFELHFKMRWTVTETPSHVLKSELEGCIRQLSSRLFLILCKLFRSLLRAYKRVQHPEFEDENKKAWLIIHICMIDWISPLSMKARPFATPSSVVILNG